MPRQAAARHQGALCTCSATNVTRSPNSIDKQHNLLPRPAPPRRTGRKFVPATAPRPTYITMAGEIVAYCLPDCGEIPNGFGQIVPAFMEVFEWIIGLKWASLDGLNSGKNPKQFPFFFCCANIPLCLSISFM